MTVPAHDIALLDLVENALPVSIGEGASDVELLVSEMVELQDDRISLTAVGARMARKEFE
jgi:hypothetical protein